MREHDALQRSDLTTMTSRASITGDVAMPRVYDELCNFGNSYLILTLKQSTYRYRY